MKNYRVVIFGCGVMGRQSVKALLEKKSFTIVGALDVEPGLVGKDLGEVLDPSQTTGIRIQNDPAALFKEIGADAVILTTTSHLRDVYPQIVQCVKAGLNVVSTCEELSFPWFRHPDLSAKIDELAVKHGVTVVGTGINPGYLMDTLPLALTAPCMKVESVEVTRMMDSSRRRLPFQKKVGTSMKPEEFRDKIKSGQITGHVGLLESIHTIAAGLGWDLDKAIELPPVPMMAEHDIETGLGRVRPGHVMGLKSEAFAEKNGKKIITLAFYAHAGVTEEYDEIIINGVPSLNQKIMGGVHGDIGTVSVTVNTVPKAVDAPPGLKIMKDLPLITVTS